MTQTRPYLPQHNEIELFQCAADNRLPVLLKGPTGCGKTRFVEYMAEQLKRPLYTIACHDDLTAADLVGRHLIGADGTYWQDGPLTAPFERARSAIWMKWLKPVKTPPWYYTHCPITAVNCRLNAPANGCRHTRILCW